MGRFKSIVQEIEEQEFNSQMYNSNVFNLRKAVKIDKYKSCDRFEFICGGEILHSIWDSEINLKFLDVLSIQYKLLLQEGSFTVSEILFWDEIVDRVTFKILIIHLIPIGSLESYITY